MVALSLTLSVIAKRLQASYAIVPEYRHQSRGIFPAGTVEATVQTDVYLHAKEEIQA